LESKNKLKQYLPSFVSGFGAAVLSIIPVLKTISCCFIVPAASVFALFLNQKFKSENSHISSREAVSIGLLTGVFSALFLSGFDLLLTFITRTNDFVEAFPAMENLVRDYSLGSITDEALNILRSMTDEIKSSGFSFYYFFIMMVSNLITNSLFGLLGGLLGMNYLNKKNKIQ
jgi:hypothetical protein